MAYIGKTPTIGNFQVCDAISVVNNQAAYTMQVGSVNVSPESANHMIVSLNGVIQKPTDAFTVSGSVITFASNLVTGDVIDFIQILGNVLDLGVPSDATVSTAKIVDGAVTSAKLASGVGGKVIQVVQGTTTTSVSNTSTSYADTGLTAAITPSATSSKILVFVNQHVVFFSSGNAAGGSLQLLKGSTVIYSGDAAYEIYIKATGSSAIQYYGRRNLNYLDSPSSTSELTYKTQAKNYLGSTSLTSQVDSIESTITLMEIAG